MTSTKCVLAIDQEITSSRVVVFDHADRIVAAGQREHEQIFPHAGWVKHNAAEIWGSIRGVVAQALAKTQLNKEDLAAVDTANQCGTTLVRDRKTGEPIYNAIVQQDTRTQKIVKELGGERGADRHKEIVGLPLATYFPGPKVKWVLDNAGGTRKRAEADDLVMGIMDIWMLWSLTGGVKGGVHTTDVINASRTMLVNLKTLNWEPSIAADMGIPMSMLSEIRPSAEVYDVCRPQGLLAGVPVAGILGDRQATAFGQACFEKSMAKSTYDTGCFMLMNTGEEIVPSKNGLLTILCYKVSDTRPIYTLEGSIAVAGSLVQRLRDNLRMPDSAPETETLTATVDDNGSAYIVSAFSGLFAPYWRTDVRDALVGPTRYVSHGHIARAVLEAMAFQTHEVLGAMEASSDVKLTELRVDGGMTANEALMQLQADQLGVDVVRSVVAETTALGAAYTVGIAIGFWGDEQDVIDSWAEDKRWGPETDEAERDRLYHNRKKVVTKILDWVDDDVVE